MRYATVAACCLAAGRLAAADGVQLFNTEVLGEPTSKAVKLLVDRTAGDAEPYVVWSDIACGTYFAASALYRKPVSFDQVRAVLNRRYAAFEVASPNSQAKPFSSAMGLWRVIDLEGTRTQRRGFSIQLTTDDEGVRVIYIAIGVSATACGSAHAGQ